MHIGVLLGNSPTMLIAIAAGALGGYVTAGINNTRRGEGLATDIRRADCQILLTDDLGTLTVRRPAESRNMQGI